MPYPIETVGPEPFMSGLVFPHAITLGNGMEEIDEILERKDIRNEHKMSIQGNNARIFFQI